MLARVPMMVVSHSYGKALWAAALLTGAVISAIGSPLAAVEPVSVPPVSAHPDCHVPLPSKDAFLVRLGSAESTRFSTIGLSGQDTPTEVATVEIEPGEQPIYIVASSREPTIWQFTGATERLEAVVLSTRFLVPDANVMATGAVGVPRGKVRFVPNYCFLTFDHGDDWRNIQAYAGLQIYKRLGRRADAGYPAYNFKGIRLPSMAEFQPAAAAPKHFKLPNTLPQARAWQAFLQRAPGGLAEFAPGDVVTPAKAVRLKTYPYEAGQLQLLASGAIEFKIIKDRWAFRILKPLHLPPGWMTKEKKVYIADDVPLPTGDIGGGYIIRESDGECLIGCA